MGAGPLIWRDLSLLWLGSGLTALVAIGLWSHARRRKLLGAFLGGARAARRLSRPDLFSVQPGRALLLLLAGIALAVAAAEPHWPEPQVPDPPRTQVILAIDVSASMQASDVASTRLAAAVDFSSRLLDGLSDHDVGLLLFAGNAYPLAPPTRDHQALRFLLDGMTPTLASAYDPGTLIGVGVDESLILFDARAHDDVEVGARHIVVVSDGDTEETEAAVREAGARARAADVTVHVVSVGTEEGSGVVMPRGEFQLGGPLVDATGARVISHLDEELLRELASAGEGRYARTDEGSSLGALTEDLLRADAPPLDGEAADDEEADPRPRLAGIDLARRLGELALILVLLESLLDTTLPVRSGPRRRRAAEPPTRGPGGPARRGA